jgi:hypothetical protein
MYIMRLIIKHLKKYCIAAPMLEIALQTIKNKYPGYCVDFLDIA